MLVFLNPPLLRSLTSKLAVYASSATSSSPLPSAMTPLAIHIIGVSAICVRCAR